MKRQDYVDILRDTEKRLETQLELVQTTILQGNISLYDMFEKTGFEKIGHERAEIHVLTQLSRKKIVWCFEFEYYRSIIYRRNTSGFIFGFSHRLDLYHIKSADLSETLHENSVSYKHAIKSLNLKAHEYNPDTIGFNQRFSPITVYTSQDTSDEDVNYLVPERLVSEYQMIHNLRGYEFMLSNQLMVKWRVK